MRRTSLLICSLLLPACGSDGTAAIDSFIQDVATQQCAWEFRCCTDGEIKTQDGRKFADQNGCVPYRQLSLEDELYTSRLAARQGRLRIDDKKAQACIASMMTRVCNARPGQPAPMPAMSNVDACVSVFNGVTPVGQPCQFAGECVQGSRCVTDKLTPGSGVCVPYQKENEICNADGDCDPSVAQLYCAKQDFKCHVRAKLGDKCAYTTDSASRSSLPLLLECDASVGNIYCDPASSTCKQLPGAGQPCLSPPPPGVSASCDPDPRLHLVCRTTTGSTSGVCMGPAKQGEDCSNVACDTGLYCASATGARTCQLLPTLGQSCSTAGQCATPYFCNFAKSPATCDQPAQLNQPCSNGSVCDVGLYCDTTQPTALCKSKLADGASCMSSLECSSDDCSATSPRVCVPAQQGGVLCIGRM